MNLLDLIHIVLINITLIIFNIFLKSFETKNTVDGVETVDGSNCQGQLSKIHNYFSE